MRPRLSAPGRYRRRPALGAAARAPTDTVTHGRSPVAPRVGASPARRGVGHQRLAKRPVEVHRASRAAAAVATARAAIVRPSASPLAVQVRSQEIDEPLDVLAVQAHLVDRLGCAAVAQLVRPVGGHDHERDTGEKGLDDGGVETWPRPCRRCRAGTTGLAVPAPGPSPKKAAERSSRCIQSLIAGCLNCAMTSGVEREPGQTHDVAHARARQLIDEGADEVGRRCARAEIH